MEWVGRADSGYNHVPYPGWAAPKLENNYIARFSYMSGNSEPHIRLPSLGVLHLEYDPQCTWL